MVWSVAPPTAELSDLEHKEAVILSLEHPHKQLLPSVKIQTHPNDGQYDYSCVTVEVVWCIREKNCVRSILEWYAVLSPEIVQVAIWAGFRNDVVGTTFVQSFSLDLNLKRCVF